MAREFALRPLRRPTLAAAFALGIGLPLLGLVMAILKSPPGVFDAIVLAQATLGCALPAVPFLSALGRRLVRLQDGILRVEATWSTREAPVSDFRLDEARIVDLRDHADLRPLLRGFDLGLVLPGLKAGPYRLRTWRRAFCLFSDPSRVLVLPHADGSVWLLGLEKPQALLEALALPVARRAPAHGAPSDVR